MEIAITGASGLIGTALIASLAESGHRPVAVVRRAPRSGVDEIAWDPAVGTIDAASLEGIGAVVHLAGAGIGDRRWSESRKREILDSRVAGTELMAKAVASADRPPAVLISGSGVGAYGNRGDEMVDEGSSRGTGFLSRVVEAWEAAAQPSIDAGIRTVFARTAMVLSARGGALGPQLPLFRLGLGGRFGPGTQWISWITIDDEIRALEHLLGTDMSGPVNLTSPHPVTNLEFTKTLGRVLRRPTMLPIPLFGPRLLFGRELVDELMLAGQRAQPSLLVRSGFAFDHPTIEVALSAVLGASK